MTWDHPRSRGDNYQIGQNRLFEEGSPPLTRGQPDATIASLMVQRITPAHAGTTMPSALRQSCRWDHPRSRGDNVVRISVPASCEGSPPLTRGQLFVALTTQTNQRITPAHAGTTFPLGIQSPCVQDHPRSRGDNVKSINRHIQS